MANVIQSLASGIVGAIGNLFKAPLDFVSGKSCSSTCGSTWDFICYIEHFCVADLFKLALIILVIYLALLFFYISYKLGIFHCICHTLCKTTGACFALGVYNCNHMFHFCCHKLLRPRRGLKWRHRNNHVKNFEVFECSSQDIGKDSEEGEESSRQNQRLPSRRWREHRKSHLRRSLRPRSHRVRVEVSHHNGARCSSKGRNRNHDDRNVHNSFKVTHTSKFVHKCRDGKRISGYRSGRN